MRKPHHVLFRESSQRQRAVTWRYKIASRFRQPLTAAEYRRPNLVIIHIPAAHHSWSVLAYNCNDFVADVARGMGIQTPVTLSPPYDFIPKLQAINQRALRPTASLARRLSRNHGPDRIYSGLSFLGPHRNQHGRAYIGDSRLGSRHRRGVV